MLSKNDWKRLDMRMVWEAKELCQSREHIAARREKAAGRLRVRGILDPSVEEIDAEREKIESEMFEHWYLARQLSGYCRP